MWTRPGLTVEEARDVEAEALFLWRVIAGYPPAVGPEAMPQGGWTETVRLNPLEVAATVRILGQRPRLRAEYAEQIRAAHPGRVTRWRASAPA